MLGCLLGGIFLASMRSPVDDLPWQPSRESALRAAAASGKSILLVADPSATGAMEGRILTVLRALGEDAFASHVLAHSQRTAGVDAWQRGIEPRDSYFVWLDPQGRELLRSPGWIGGARYRLYSAYAQSALTRRKRANLSGLERLRDQVAAGELADAEAFISRNRSSEDAKRLCVDLAEHYLNRRFIHTAMHWAKRADPANLPTDDRGRLGIVLTGLGLFKGDFTQAYESVRVALGAGLSPAERAYAQATASRLKDRIGGPVVHRSR